MAKHNPVNELTKIDPTRIECYRKWTEEWKNEWLGTSVTFEQLFKYGRFPAKNCAHQKFYAENSYYDHLMIAAAENGHLDVVKLAVNKDASRWMQAFTAASYHGHLDIMQWLFDHFGPDFDGMLIATIETAFRNAEDGYWQEIMDWLKKQWPYVFNR